MSDSATPLPLDQRLDLAEVTRGEFINAIINLYPGELGEASCDLSRRRVPGKQADQENTDKQHQNHPECQPYAHGIRKTSECQR